MVYAIVTLQKSGNSSHKLFFCTKAPRESALDYRNCADDAIREYGKEDIRYLPPATCSAETLKYHTMKARLSDRWKNTMYEAVKALNGW
ncbi:hypothetical protein D7V86_03235 [bacterium D16-51]|nr:hypothetical protein D7V96_02410 [bacterium D16-59]RKI62139.1 hypothetical protein D7V86_03235 [bacterium D16-51]